MGLLGRWRCVHAVGAGSGLLVRVPLDWRGGVGWGGRGRCGAERLRLLKRTVREGITGKARGAERAQRTAVGGRRRWRHLLGRGRRGLRGRPRVGGATVDLPGGAVREQVVVEVHAAGEVVEGGEAREQVAVGDLVGGRTGGRARGTGPRAAADLAVHVAHRHQRTAHIIVIVTTIITIVRATVTSRVLRAHLVVVGKLTILEGRY